MIYEFLHIQHKICYNDLLYDEKTIDCINAIEDLLKERKKYTIRLTDEEYRRVIDIAQKDIAEQKDKRIKELEEENYVQKIQIYENSIPKQELKEKLEKIQSLYEKNLKELDLKEVEKIDIKIFESIRLEIQRGLIRELLEGERK